MATHGKLLVDGLGEQTITRVTQAFLMESVGRYALITAQTHELFDVKDDNKGSVMHIGDSSANIIGVKWRIWWFAPASSACYQMRTMA